MSNQHYQSQGNSLSEEKFKRIFEVASDGLIYMDTSGRIVDVNEQAVRIFGGSKEDLLGKHFTRVGVVSSTNLPRITKAFASILLGRGAPLEVQIRNKKGQMRFLECSYSVMKTDGKLAGILAIARDITERKKAEKALLESQQKFERLAAIGQVAAMVGHDLRNPLTGIKGAAYYLKTKPALRKGKKTMEMLELIEKDIEYSNKIITDLLECSRDVHLELTETTPKLIIGETLSLLEVPNNIQVINLTESDPRIKADIEKLNRAFVNLIKNAIDAMPYGGKLTIKSTGTNDNVEFTFADTGMGMTKEQMGKIWTPFFTTKAKGMGLGLPICKRIIEAHKGYITVESMPGIGTTFTVTIPIEPKPTEGGEKVWVNVSESLSSMTTKASEKC